MDASVSRPGSWTAKFESEVLSNYSSLRAFAISLCRNAERADDLTQETVLRALDAHKSFQPGSNMPAWLFTILRNLFRSQYRKSRHETAWKPEYDNWLHFSFTSEGADETVDFKQFLKLLACIPIPQADALVAIGYLQMPYEDASVAIRCNVGTIKSRVNRARESLRDLMDNPTAVEHIDIDRLKHATDGLSQDDAYYPIARAYEELYSVFTDADDIVDSSKVEHKNKPETGLDTAWRKLLASGVLQEDDSDLTEPPGFDEEDP